MQEEKKYPGARTSEIIETVTAYPARGSKFASKFASESGVIIFHGDDARVLLKRVITRGRSDIGKGSRDLV